MSESIATCQWRLCGGHLPVRKRLFLAGRDPINLIIRGRFEAIQLSKVIKSLAAAEV